MFCYEGKYAVPNKRFSCLWATLTALPLPDMIRPLFWLVLAFFIATAIANSKPLHELAAMTTETGTIWKRQAEDCTDINNCRTIYNIIWGALATTFACVWTAMHPNVPSRQETRVRRITRRVELVVLGLLAPELVAARAFAEWSDARRIANGLYHYFLAYTLKS